MASRTWLQNQPFGDVRKKWPHKQGHNSSLACPVMDAPAVQGRAGSRKRRRPTPEVEGQHQQSPPPPTRTGGSSSSHEHRSPTPEQEQRPLEARKRRGRPPGKKAPSTANKVREGQIGIAASNELHGTQVGIRSLQRRELLCILQLGPGLERDRQS